MFSSNFPHCFNCCINLYPFSLNIVNISIFPCHNNNVGDIPWKVPENYISLFSEAPGVCVGLGGWMGAAVCVCVEPGSLSRGSASITWFSTRVDIVLNMDTLCSTAYVLSHFSCVWLFATLWTVARQAPLSMGFSRQEYWSGLPLLSPGDLPDPGLLHCRQILHHLSHQGSPLLY